MSRVLASAVLMLAIVVVGTVQRADAQSGLSQKGEVQLAQLVFCVPPKLWSKKLQRCVNPFVKKRVRCKAPRVWSSRQGRCVFPVVDDNRCGPKEVFSTASEACVCREGYERQGEACVLLAGQTEGTDYAEVQRCLNELGFNAGRVDGQPGQRTRRALRQFQREAGLENRPRRLNDPVTLERLFKECQAEKIDTAKNDPAKGEAPKKEEAAQPEPEAEEVQAAPLPVEEKEEAATSSGPVAGAYPNVLCVSKGVRKALSKVASNVPVCGEACVPIPPGMNQEQLQQSEQEYAVKWCRSCIRIGKAGIVCSK